MINVAHAIMQEDDTEAPGLTVTDPDHAVTQGLPTNFIWLTIPPYDDGVSPTNGGAEVIQYTGTTWTAVTVFEGVSVGSVVYYSFPLYCLAQLERETLTINSVNWLLPQEHDLAVALEVPVFLKPGDSLLLNATVYNRGLSNETDVELFVLINGSTVNNVTISKLLPRSSYTLSCAWTPTIEGLYNVTAYASPVPGEEYLANNVASRYVGVGVVPPGVTAVYVSPYNTTVMLGQNFTITIMVANVEDLYGWDVKLHYNTSVIQCTEAFYPPDHVFARQPFVGVIPIIDNTLGYVQFGCSLMDEVPRFNGTGKLCTFAFNGASIGDSGLVFSKPYGEYTFLFNFDLEVIPALLVDGIVEVYLPPVIRDVAISYVSPSATQVYTGWTVNITAVAVNKGDVNENFTITAYYNNSPIEAQTVTDLAPEENITLTFSWNTVGVTPANYTIKAEASIIPEEINTGNNIFVDGEVRIKMFGDVNGDGKVDMKDIALIARNFGKK